MSTLWLHVELVPSQGDMVSIGRDEARHAFGARRLHAGDMVTLFDGCGGLAQARLSETRTRDGEYLVELAIQDPDAPKQKQFAVRQLDFTVR